ncbi:MAG: hypothetical protein ACTHN5_12275 [Phycisphaerae bacterium]
MRYDIPPHSHGSPLQTIPGSFQDELQRALPTDAAIHFLAYSAEFVTAGTQWPAFVLALSDDQWLLLRKHGEAPISAVSAKYAETVLVERTSILLYGQIRIDYASTGATHAATMEFDNVDERRYKEAIERLVGAIENVPIHAQDMALVFERLGNWPLKFRHAAANHLLGGRHIQSGVTWPALTSGYRRELSPAAALLITKQEILLLSEDRTWSQVSGSEKYGIIATYYPRSRLARAYVESHARFSVLHLEMHASHGGETVEILVPRSAADAVEEALRLFQ